jgi:hypothetical protein
MRCFLPAIPRDEGLCTDYLPIRTIKLMLLLLVSAAAWLFSVLHFGPKDAETALTALGVLAGASWSLYHTSLSFRDHSRRLSLLTMSSM